MMNHSFAIFALSLLFATMILAEEACQEHPFNVEVVIPAKKGEARDFGCSPEENLFMAEQIASDINFVFVRTGERFGVIRSRTRICKEGELLARHELISNRRELAGETENGVRHLRSFSVRQRFIFRGTGSCTLCSIDNHDFRRGLLSNSTSITIDNDSPPLAATASEAAEDWPFIASKVGRHLQDGSDSSEDYVEKTKFESKSGDYSKHKNITEEAENNLEEMLADFQDNAKNLRKNRKKFKKTKNPRSRWKKIKELSKKNDYGYSDYLRTNTLDYKIGFYIDEHGQHKYYYKYKKDVYNYKTLSEILSQIVKIKFDEASINSDLCTFGKIEELKVKFKPTRRFGFPKC